MSVRTFLGEMGADQAAKLSIAMQESGPFRPEQLVQARSASGGWRLMLSDGCEAKLLCEDAARWPNARHDPDYDASTWPGKAIEADNEMLAANARAAYFSSDIGDAQPAAQAGAVVGKDPAPQPKIHAIRSGTVIGTNFPVPEVVEALEHYLEQAKRGEISAVGIALVRPNRAVAVNWVEGNAPANLMVAAASILNHRVQTRLQQAMDDEA